MGRRRTRATTQTVRERGAPWRWTAPARWTTRRGAALTYAWSQTAGPTVGLDGATSETAAFHRAAGDQLRPTLTFSLTVDSATADLQRQRTR